MGPVTLNGDLNVPAAPKGFVLFAHGSGSSRHSPRNRYVAEVLNEHSLGTLLVDLLTAEEEREDEVTAQLRFDIGLLTQRLVAIADWLADQPQASGHQIGLFGASTGAAAALLAAGQRPKIIKAVVSRGGRPDLAGPGRIPCPRPNAIDRRRQGYSGASNESRSDGMDEVRDQTRDCSRRNPSVRGAGNTGEVARLAADWFTAHLK